jgi:hypothetical protein
MSYNHTNCCFCVVANTQEMKAKLPASAHSIYYVDQIGNVSTSDVRKNSAEVRSLAIDSRHTGNIQVRGSDWQRVYLGCAQELSRGAFTCNFKVVQFSPQMS